MLSFVWILLAVGVGPGRAAESGPDAEAPAVEAVYDPYRGMDPDGTIPKVDKAALVSRPERWRYVPEGRLKPGNFFSRFLVSSFVVPIVFQDSDVGTGLGAAITDIDFRGKRRREFLGAFLSYTTEGQQSYVLRWRRWLKHLEVPGGGVLQEERSYVGVGGGYRKTLTSRFFGLGPSTQHRDETSYTDEVAFLELGLSHSLDGRFDDVVVTGGLRGEQHWLGKGHVSGEADMRVVYPVLFDEADPYGLGWLDLGLRWDTRDSQQNPYRGSNVGASINAALGQNDGNVGALYNIYADKVFPVPGIFHDGGSDAEENPPTDGLALHFQTQLSSGTLPFFVRPTLGGSETLRGYIAGRWRDDAAWEAAVEYRFWVIPRGFTVWRHIRVERLGLAVFYEVGAVADDGFAFFHERVRQSYGFSGRATIERSAIFRADFGFSDEGLNFSAGFGLAF